MPGYEYRHVANKRINPFTGRKASDASDGYSVRLETLAGKRPLWGLIKPPADPEVLAIL